MQDESHCNNLLAIPRLRSNGVLKPEDVNVSSTLKLCHPSMLGKFHWEANHCKHVMPMPQTTLARSPPWARDAKDHPATAGARSRASAKPSCELREI